MKRLAQRRGMAIPLVMGFCFLAAVFLGSLSSTRVQDKRQNLITFQQLKAYYMAQGAIQHALLKIRILPNEVYDASALARGVCPFIVDPENDGLAIPEDQDHPLKLALEDFVSDVNTEELELELNSDGEQADWSYAIVEAKALTTFTKADSDDSGAATKVNVIELVAEGVIQDKLETKDGAANSKERRERVVKVVEITRGVQ